MIKATNNLTGKLNSGTIHVYPELESIEVTPSMEDQLIKSDKYGISQVLVFKIPATDIEIKPSFEEQIKEGIFKTVRVVAIPEETLDIIPTEQIQNVNGLFAHINIDAIKAQEIEPELNFNATDIIELRLQDGEYIKKAIINKPKSLTSNNIKVGETIFGIAGELVDTSDGNIKPSDILAGKIAYSNNQRIVGIMPNNGALEFEPSEEEQVIPSGLTTGGIVKATDITTLNEYKECLNIANDILGGAE